MLGISKVWENMSNIDQAALIELIAGKQRGNSITALLTSMSQAEEILNTSLNSEGSAMKEQETRMDSLEAKITQLKAAFESLSSTIINGDFLKGLVDWGTKGTQGIEKLTTTLGGFKGVLMATIAAFTLFKRNSSMNFLSKMADSTRATSSKFSEMSENFGIYYGLYRESKNKKGKQLNPIKAYGKAMRSTASEALGLSTALGKANLAIMAVSTVATIGSAIYGHYKQKQEDARVSALEGLETYKETETAITSYIDRVAQLREKLDSGDLSNDEQYSVRSELLAIEQEITSQYGSQVGQIDLINGKLSEQLSLVQEISDAELQSWENRNKRAIDKSTDIVLHSGDSDFFKYGSSISSYVNEFANEVFGKSGVKGSDGLYRLRSCSARYSSQPIL